MNDGWGMDYEGFAFGLWVLWIRLIGVWGWRFRDPRDCGASFGKWVSGVSSETKVCLVIYDSGSVPD